jgi:hypothetical protein
MKLDVWKLMTIVMAGLLVVYYTGPMITGLFSYDYFANELTCINGKCVELFVMSHCPYGTQAEKGIIPAIEALGNNVDFHIRFVYYAMHGQTELNEELRQYCIQYEQRDKFIDYLTCFLDSGDSSSCLTSAGVNINQLNTCVARADTAFNVTNMYNDQATWLSGRYPLFNAHESLNEEYGIRGSPQLVVNGEVIQPASRSPQGYLDAICEAFTQQPAACNTQLSTTAYSTGFGYTGGSSSSASCS